MAFTTMDGIAVALPGQVKRYWKAQQTSKGAGIMHSMWKAAGNPAAGSNPGSLNGVVPTDATTGAFAFVNPAGGVDTYLAMLDGIASTVGTIIVYDRLWACSTASGTNTGSNAVTFPGLTRSTNGADVEIWIEVYTPTGATPQTLTVTYTDQDGNAGQSGTVTLTATTVAGQMIGPVALAAGDTGARAVSAFQLGGSTGTAGDYGLTMLKRLASIPIAIANVAGPIKDWLALGGVEIEDDACLALMVDCSTTNTGNLFGQLSLIQG